MNKKAKTVFSVVILLVVSIVSFCFWLSEISDYLEFPEEIVFSWISLSLISIPIMFAFPLYWFFLSLRHGEKYALKKINGIMPLFKLMCVFTFALSCAMSFGYLSALKSKGYTLCSGVPSGWTPGTASKYVVDKKLCFSSGLQHER
ncbi:DUF1240 domain-containing protein [Pantoea sp. WMus005]|uniref:DUF1240 domain-containing protein n=1 Tax=Pantoea sp. WMus005 TaxID=2750734 RepID=UPI0015D0BECE|nr:DUF1240 domain-containing protein [Pantoea sp. WMus005]NYS28412.1 DUF1240 domain-containing protein [Pantoea sp. WMus005]